MQTYENGSLIKKIITDFIGCLIIIKTERKFRKFHFTFFFKYNLSLKYQVNKIDCCYLFKRKRGLEINIMIRNLKQDHRNI